MPTPIIQELGFDVVQAINNLNQLNGSISSFNRRVNSLGRNLQNFNQSGQAVTRTLQQVGQGSQHLANVTQHAQRLTVTWETLVRVVATQIIVKTLRQIQHTFEDASASAIKFQTSVAQALTIADGSLGNLDQASASIRRLSDEFNTPLDQTVAATYDTLSSQVAKGEDALQLIGTAAKFAKATLTDLDDSVGLLAGTINAYGLSTTDAEAVASKFFKVLELGRVRGSELAHGFNVVSGQAAQLGVSFEEVGSAVAVLTRRSVPFRQVITQISGILNALTKQSVETQRIFRELGYETAQQAIQSKGLGGVLIELATAQGNVAEEIAKVFPNIRGLRGALTLGAQASEDFADALETIRSTASTLNQEKFDEIVNIDAQRLSKEFNKFSNFLTAEVGPAVNKVTLGILDMVGGMDSLISVLRSSESAILGVTTGMSLLIARSRLAVFETSKLAATLGRLGGPAIAIGLGISIAEFLDRLITESRSKAQREAEARGQELVDSTRKQEEERLRIVNQTNNEIFRGIAASFQDASRLYLRETVSIEQATASFQENINTTLKATVSANETLLQKLRQIAVDVNNIVIQSTDRVFNLQDQIRDREFGRLLQGRDARSQVGALRSRAEDISRTASRLLANAATDTEVNRALNQFRRAEGFANQALQLADSLDPSASIFASRTLDEINKRQIRAEQQLQTLQQKRAAEADELRQQQQSITEELKAQARIVADNLDPKTGDKEARDAAIRRIEQLRLGTGDLSTLDRLGLDDFVAEFQQELQRSPLRLQFDIDSGIANIKARIQQSFDDFEIRIGLDLARELESAVGRDLQGPGQFNQALAELEREATALEQAISQREIDLARLDATRLKFIALADDLQSERFTRDLLSGFGLGGPDRDEGFAILDSIAERIRSVGKEGRLTADELNEIGKEMVALNDVVQRATVFGVNFAGPLADDAARLADQFAVLKQFMDDVQALDESTIDQQRLNQLNSLIDSARSKVDQIKATGDTLFEGGLSNLNRMEQGLDRVLNRANGGSIPQNFAHGGSPRGTDTVMASLTPGEFVVNRRASQQFFSQLQQINAGVRPRFQDGGPVTNVGDITINVNESATPRLTGREVATALRREFRRGTSRL